MKSSTMGDVLKFCFPPPNKQETEEMRKKFLARPISSFHQRYRVFIDSRPKNFRVERSCWQLSMIREESDDSRRDFQVDQGSYSRELSWCTVYFYLEDVHQFGEVKRICLIVWNSWQRIKRARRAGGHIALIACAFLLVNLLCRCRFSLTPMRGEIGFGQVLSRSQDCFSSYQQTRFIAVLFTAKAKKTFSFACRRQPRQNFQNCNSNKRRER